MLRTVTVAGFITSWFFISSLSSKKETRHLKEHAICGNGIDDNVVRLCTIFFHPKKISWERNYSARYWFHSALKKS